MNVLKGFEKLTQEKFDDYLQDIECDFDTNTYGSLNWGEPEEVPFYNVKRMYLYAEKKDGYIEQIIFTKNENDEYTIYEW